MSERDGRTPVMADVARLAGVSHQTVSRVLNGHPNVRTETVVRVRAAIEELGYRRNPSARALVTRRTNLLGVLAFDSTLFGPARTLAAIENAAREAGYFVSIVNLDGITREAVVEAATYLVEQSVEGCIAIAPQRAVVEALADLSGLRPLVAVEGGEGSGLPVVCVDQEGGAYTATRHLLDLGHRTVHHIAGKRDWLEGEARVEGWRRALAEAGAPVPEPAYGDWSPRSGYELGLRLAGERARGAEVTAVFVANDQMSIGVLRAFHEHGIGVPGDVSVVGFDDIPEAEYLTPALTTVWQDFDQVGRASIDVLLAELSDGGGPSALRPPVTRHRPGAAASRRGGTPSTDASGAVSSVRVVVPARMRIRHSTAPRLPGPP
ncbi:LacI family DNA-binding transcriptional regulator [Nocardiopsis sp. FIRDI 009]|uniref:LacI family DNA-binding transcriptional regulator n=1 Tax=Nocardiopsis sp. FIRDI 009 TaxID=714197 RepID=UPI001E4C952C|nr:LacI family DNA-binding transcriptional regulator [Nocardiopsis sp. FIRDI 009]